MTWTDITVPIRPGMAIFEGDPPLVIAQVSDMQEGGICNLSRMEATLHLGTHIDAPAHVLARGVLLDILIVIIAFIFAVTINNTITKEASAIGTLRASGYTRGELVRHYLAMPVIVTLAAASKTSSCPCTTTATACRRTRPSGIRTLSCARR